MDDNVKNFNKPKVRPYLSDDGVTPITKEEALQEMMNNARAYKLADDIADNLGYDGCIGYREKEGDEAYRELINRARAMTASANDDLYVLTNK